MCSKLQGMIQDCGLYSTCNVTVSVIAKGERFHFTFDFNLPSLLISSMLFVNDIHLSVMTFGENWKLFCITR